MLSLCPFDISVGVGAFVIGLSQISSFFSLLVAYSVDDVRYVWRYGTDSSVEQAPDLHMSQFDLISHSAFESNVSRKGCKYTYIRWFVVNAETYVASSRLHRMIPWLPSDGLKIASPLLGWKPLNLLVSSFEVDCLLGYFLIHVVIPCSLLQLSTQCWRWNSDYAAILATSLYTLSSRAHCWSCCPGSRSGSTGRQLLTGLLWVSLSLNCWTISEELPVMYLRSADYVGRPFCFFSVSYYYFSFLFFSTAVFLSGFLRHFSTDLDQIWRTDSP